MWEPSFVLITTSPFSICSSGQQILRGDRVIVKGEKPGKKSRLMIKV